MGTMKARGWIIIIVIALVLIIVVAAASSSGPPASKTPKTSSTISVTVNSDIGVDRIAITNINTGQTYTATLIDLPFQFNCTRGDYLRVSITTQPGFQWNAWEFSPVGRFDDANPLLINSDDARYCVNNQINLTPRCIILEVSPTTTPIPSITPTPTSPAFREAP